MIATGRAVGIPAFLGPWLRALWDVAPPILPLADADAQTFVETGTIHLAIGHEAANGPPRFLRASTAHAAAHLVHGIHAFDATGVPPITQAITGVLEDARSEFLASHGLPGLQRLWVSQHSADPASGDDFESLLLRLARALADPRYEDAHPWIRKGRTLFWRDPAQQVLAEPRGERMCALASLLGHDIGQMRLRFNARLYRPGPAYRDDNRWLWQRAAAPLPEGSRERGAREGNAPPLPAEVRVFHYPEWDARAGNLRPGWCTVRESAAVAASEAVRATALADARADSRLVEALRGRARARPRLQSADAIGDALLLQRVVDFLVGVRACHVPAEPKLFRRRKLEQQGTSALILIDASASSGEARAPGLASGLEQAQEAAARLATAMLGAGWRVAVQDFRSVGRHDVQVRRLLAFDEVWGEASLGKLAGLSAGLSTRLGAALRHAAHVLARESTGMRWLVVLGDGEPHDIDVHDADYLERDARHAVRSARQVAGCLCLWPVTTQGGGHARRVFGRASGPMAPLARSLLRMLATAPSSGR